MHPFGGTPICPRCGKVVYAAEQIMGPGRKLYHKPCLTCTTCGKRLDSLSLVEHNQEPYCKTCHVKNFGTRDLRHANLPTRDDIPISPPTSPTRTTAPASFSTPPPPALPPRRTGASSPPPIIRPTRSGATSPPLVKPTRTGATSPPPILRPTRTYSPAPRSAATSTPAHQERSTPVRDAALPPREVKAAPAQVSTPTHTGRSAGGLPRTVPLPPASMSTPVKRPLAPSLSISSDSSEGAEDGVKSFGTGGSGAGVGNNIVNGRMVVPLGPSATGTRYGAALGGPISPMSTGKQWGAGAANPTCGRCGKTVYFAEQVKAIGKTFHKGCLRCTECNTSLASGRLTENEGSPYCQRCYGKLYGPQGSGYALLGKAGG